MSDELERREAQALVRERDLAEREMAIEAEVMGVEGRCRLLEKKLRKLRDEGVPDAEWVIQALPRPAPPPGVAERQRAEAARLEAVEIREESAARRQAALSYLAEAIEQALSSLNHCAERAQTLEMQRLSAVPTPTPEPAPPPPSNRRDTYRQRVDTQITLGSRNNFYTGFARNISSGGIYIATVDVLNIGDEVDVNFTLPSGMRIRGRAVVRWTQEVHEISADVWPGMGIEFIELDPQSQDAINQFMQLREPMFFVE